MKFFLILSLLFSSVVMAQSKGTAYPDKENRVQECQQCSKLTNKLHIHKGVLFCPVCVIKNRLKVTNKAGNAYKTYPFAGKKVYTCKRCQRPTQRGYYYKKKRELYCQPCAIDTAEEKLGSGKKKKSKTNTSLASNRESEKVAYFKKLVRVQKCRTCGMLSNKLFDGDGFLYCHNCARKQGYRTAVKVGLGKVVLPSKKKKKHEKVYIKKFKHGKRCQKCKTHARNLYQGKKKLYCYKCVVTNSFEIVAAPKTRKKTKKKPVLAKRSSKKEKSQSKKPYRRTTTKYEENHQKEVATTTTPQKEETLPKKKKNPIVGLIVLLAMFPLTYFICRMGGLFFKGEEEEEMGDVDFS